MDAAPHVDWVDCVDDEGCRAFCTCGWETPEAPISRREAQRLAAVHQSNSRRRALAVPLGDLEEDVIARILRRMIELMGEGTGAEDALALARADEVHGRLGGQLTVGLLSPEL